MEPPQCIPSLVYTFLFHKGRYVSRFVWRRVGKQSPQLSLARVTREVESCVTDVKKWGLIVHLWRRESALASISRGPLFPLPPSPPPPPFKLSGKLLVTKWKRGRKERTGQAPLLRPVVHFSIKTSCLFPRAFDSAPFTALVSIRSWTTLDAQLINRIISRGRWCNWSGSGCNQRERDLSKFFTFGSRWRETLERWNYYETLTVWWEKTKYGVWFGEYIIAGGNYAAHRP